MNPPGLPDLAPSQIPFWRQVLRGFSQCAFQANELTALFFIAAATLFNWRMGAAYVLSVIIGTATARVLKGQPDLLGLGLYGFNSGLMGLALANFFEPGPATWIWVTIMAAIVAAVTCAMARWSPLPFLAAPFILMFWVLWPLAEIAGVQKISLGAFADAPVALLHATVVALGATLFAPSVGVGLLFLTGIAISNWRHAVVALMGAALASALAAHVGAPGTAINSGFIGFNAVLASLAAYALVGKDLRFAALAALISTWIFSYVGRHAPAPALASGFVFAVWIILLAGSFSPYFAGETARQQSAESASGA